MTKARDDIDRETVVEMLDYDPETGVFRWKSYPKNGYAWNGRFPGKIAGTINDSGYVIIVLRYRGYRAHRLAWLIMAG